MKHSLLFYKNFKTLLLILTFSSIANAQLLNNGDFESGGVGVGFDVASAYTLLPAATGNTVQGNYAFTNNPQPFNAVFISSGDHTTGAGKMMIVDGSSDTSFPKFWKAGNTGGGVCGLTPGLTYKFSYWVKTISSTSIGTFSRANIIATFNNTNPVGAPVVGATIVPVYSAVVNNWVQVVYNFVPTSACVNIELSNSRLGAAGNDFAIDDLQVLAPVPPLSISSSFLNASCTGLNDGSISINAISGQVPYTYNLTGQATSTNTSDGVFRNLAPRIYNLSITDGASTTVSGGSITITEPKLIVNPTINLLCPNQNANLTVSGGTNYTWTANPVDATLTNPNIFNPIVTPTANTVYTVTSTTPAVSELAYNGNFALGNVGFTSDYVYVNPTNTAGLQKRYGIVTNPSTWFNTFLNCTNNPTGIGNMMVVDGSNVNAGADKLWCQKIPVAANTNYTFSYYIQSVVAGSLATLETKINGISQGVPLAAPAVVTCSNWTPVTYTWNSGLSTLADICIFDTNTSVAGNDFAIDDVSFKTVAPTVCNISNTVTVNIGTTGVTLTNVPSNFTVCAGVRNVATTFGSNTAAVTYTWTNSNPAIGIVASGTGNLTDFVLTNTTNAPITATIVVRATEPVSTCSSPTQTYVITVKPIILVQQADVFICNAISQPSIGFSSLTPLTANEEFYWTNDELLIGLPSDGVGAIPAFVSIINSTSENLNATITVYKRNKTTQALSDCGMTFRIILKPAIVATCNNPINLLGNPNTTIAAVVNVVEPPGTYIYTWTVPTGFANPGNVASFTFPPASFLGVLNAGTYNFSVKVKNNVTGCESVLENCRYIYGIESNPASNFGTITNNNPLGLNICSEDATITSCTTLDASFLDVRKTNSYTVTSIPYNFLTFVANSGVSLCKEDDAYTLVYNLPFDFCFFGQNYTKYQIGTNIFMKFFANTATTNPECDDDTSGYIFNENIGNPAFNSAWRNSIYFPMQDTDPRPAISPDASITRNVDGVAPNRKVVFTVLNMGQFSCQLSAGPQESQLVLYESTNVIEINVKRRTNCAWNNDSAVIGLLDSTGTQSFAPPGRNSTDNWKVTDNPESWRFTPSGTLPATTFEWLDASNNVLSNNPVFEVCPTAATTTYTAKVTYDICNVAVPITRDFVVKLNIDQTNAPVNINNIPGTNTYNLNVNKAIILGALPVNSNSIKFYPSLTDVIALTNLITNLTTYPGTNGQEIIAVIRNNASSCITYKSFKLFNTDPSNSGPVCSGLTFGLNTPDIGLGGTYSWTSPNGFSSALSNPTNIDSNIYGAGIYTIETYLNGVLQSTRSTTLIINPLPTITSFTPLKSSVCSGTSTSLQVVGTPDSVIDFNDGTVITQLTIPPNGTLQISTGNLTTVGNYKITRIKNNATTCERIFAPAQTVTVTIDTPVNAGVDGTTTVCGNNFASINLNTIITGEQLDGTWQDVSFPRSTAGTFVQATGTFTPDSNPIFNTTRKFSYTLPADGDCPADTSEATVTFNNIPNGNLTVDKTTICQGFDSPILTFSGSNGSAPYTFSYTLNGGLPIDIVTTTGNSVTLPVPTSALATLTYCLTRVQDANCLNVLTSAICRTVNVLDAPAALPPSDYVVCDDNITFDGRGQFDLHTKDSEISTVPGIQINYYLTEINAMNGTSDGEISTVAVPIYVNITNPQIIYARVFDPTTPACYSTVALTLRVTPRPTLNAALKPFEICDVTGPTLNDGFETFTLSDKDADIIGAQTSAVVRYYFDEQLAIANVSINALPNSYPNISNPQTIWYTITFTATGCQTTGSVKLKVNPIPVAPALSVGYAAFEKCNITTTTPGLEKFDLTSKIPMLLNGQNGVAVTFYETQAQAITGLPANAIPNPTAYTNLTLAPQTIWVRLTNNLTKCYAISTMNLIVFPLPIPNPIIPDEDLTICDGDSDGKSIFNLSKLIPLIINNPAPIQPLTVTFYNTPENAQGGLVGDQLPLLFPNTNPFSQTIYARLQNSVTGCFAIKLITLKIDPAPKLPLNPALKDITECDEDLINDQDGKTEINLTQQNAFFFAAGLNAPTSNFEISYYNTSVDANTAPAGINQIINPSSYIGTDAEIIWVRIENKTTKCFEVTSFKLIINKPLVIPALNLLSLCDTSPTNTTPRTTPFNLVLNRNAAALANATPPANYTVSYYTNATIPRAYTGLITNPTAYVNTSSPQTLGVIVTNITTGCKSYSTLTIEVLTIPTSGLTTNPALGTNPNLAPVITKCDDDNVLPLLTEVFDLTTNSAAIINNNATLTLHYYPTKVDAELGTNEIVLPTLDPENYRAKTGSVWIQLRSTTLNSQGVYCFDLIEQPLKVNPLPILDLLDAQTHPGNLFRKCEIVILPPPATPVKSQFDLTSLETELNVSNSALPVTTPIATTFPIIFYTNPNDAVAGNNPITNDTAYESTVAIGVRQRIYYSIKNSLTGCFNYGSFEIIVDNKPIITLPPVVAVCDDNDGTNDGLVAYPLDDALKITILGNQTLQPLTGFTVTFYTNKIDADAGTNKFTDLLGHQAQTGSLWIRVENNLTTCYNIAESVQTVEIIPEPTIETLDNNNTICVNYLTGDLERGLILRAKNNKPRTGVTNTYKWFLEDVAGIFNLVGTNATYEITTSASDPEKPRRFKLEMSNVNTNPLLTCPVTSTIFDVYQSGPAVAKAGTIGYFVTNAFESNQTITVTVDGYGTYQYSLDEGDKQDSPVFESVSLEDHKITVWDVEGNGNPCKEFTIENVSTIDYPHYFTPNGDGINDTWNIVGLKKQTDAKIYIFDREGKLVKQVSPDGQGWDGTRNENLMPSTDYWFTVDYTEQKLSKQFKSHFSLKR